MMRFLFFLFLVISSNVYSNELEDSQELISLLATNSKLDSLKYANVIVVQDNVKKMSSPSYDIINNQIIDIISKSKLHNVVHVDSRPFINIIGTLSSLKITKSKAKVRDIAIAHNADAIFFWNLTPYKNNLYFTARVVNVQNDKTIWSFQKDLKTLHAEQAAIMRYDGPLKLPLQSSIILSGNVDFTFDNYKKNESYKRKSIFDQNSKGPEYMMGVSVEYLTSMPWNPKVSIGVLEMASTELASDPQIIVNQLLVDFRYQLNSYTAPVYDSSTGDILDIRNKQKYSIGASVGPAFTFVSDAKDIKVPLAARIYFNAALSDSLEYNVGLSYIRKKMFALKSNSAYSEKEIDLGGINLFMSIGYKFKLNKDK